MRVRVDTHELTEMVADIRRSRAAIRRILPREVEEAWEDVTRAAKARAPVDTGRLRSGLDTEVEEERPGRVTGDTVSEAPYTSAVEYASNGRPFLRATFDGHARGAVRQTEQGIFREIDRII